jgi:aminopeptidase N
MYHRIISAIVIIAITSLSAAAQAPILYEETHLSEPDQAPREHPLDMQRMKIEVSFEPQKSLVKGIVTHYFMPLRSNVDSVYFDAPKITIKEAKLNGKALRIVQTAEGVNVFPSTPMHWGEMDSITFVYEATPRRGLYFIGWNDPKNMSRKQIWTQGEGTDNRFWVPSYDDWDDKLITETIIHFDKDYQVLSNGTLISEKEEGNGMKVWHYKMTHPHSSYLVMLGIGKYAVEKRKTKAGVPVNLWYYPEHPEYVKTTYHYATECIDFVANWTGIPYPWESYSQIPVQDFIYGAMENTTATIYGDFFLNDSRAKLDRDYMGVDVHELTHQWFGDLITIRTGKEMWLHESYATFFPKLFTREILGQDAYQWNRRGEHNAMIGANDADRYPIVHPKQGTSRVYPGGSAVIGMMLYAFGEEEMRHVIHYYLKKHSYQNVETNDLYQAFQDTLGLSPDWFFDEWLYRGGYPIYDVSYQNTGRETQITVAQTQHTDNLTKLFKMPIVFEVHYTDGSMDSKREWVEKQTTTIALPNNGKQISYVLFDPGSEVIKKVNFKKSHEELKAQALGAKNMIDRYDAIVALRNDSTSATAKRDLLIQLYNKETYQATRSEIVSQLSSDQSIEARAIIRRAIKDTTLDVRNAVINAYRYIPTDLEADMQVLLKDSSYSMIVTALDKLSESFPQNTQKYLDMTSGVDGKNMKVKIKWLELKAASGDQQALNELVEYTSGSYEFITRQNAMNSLSRLNYMDNALAENLVDALLSTNNRLAGSAHGILATYYSQTKYRDMMLAYSKSKSWEPWQKEILDRVVK